MKIDWKEVAKSQVYKDLKQTLIYSLNKHNTDKQKGQHPWYPNKSVYFHKFNTIIGRAKHIAHHKSITLVQALELLKKNNNNYLSVMNTSCLTNRLDRNNPLCYQQKLPKNKKIVGKLKSKKKYPKHRW